MEIKSLASVYPKLAKEAWQWNPEVYSYGSGVIKSWKGECGHIWEAEIKNRTRGQGCPYCSNKKILIGFNDLATTNPELLDEIYGWNPQTVTAGSQQRKKWKGKCGHIWEAIVKTRTSYNPSGCPFCSNKKLLIGFNDLFTVDPDLASEACGWNAKKCISGSHQNKMWLGKCGHKWTSIVRSRQNGSGCPYCAGTKVLKGFNDLLTKNPKIASEAYNWDASHYTEKSGEKKLFKCKKCNNIWKTQIKSRTSCNYTGCPNCAISGFKENKISYLYLIEKNNLMKIGVGNKNSKRIESHIKKGWVLVDIILNLKGKEAKKY